MSAASHVYRIESDRRCRICGCSQERRPEVGKRARPADYTACFDLVPVWRGGPQVVRSVCNWVGPDLCSHCAEDGGPKSLHRDNPEHYSTLVDRFGQPLLKAEFLPK